MLAFWMGGACPGPEAEEEPEVVSGGAPLRHKNYEQADYPPRRRPNDADLRSDVPLPPRGAPAPVGPAPLDDRRFDAAELAAAVTQFSETGGFPARVVLPTRTIDTSAASEEDMAFLMFAFFMATDD